jgi:hypothetical protein
MYFFYSSKNFLWHKLFLNSFCYFVISLEISPSFYSSLLFLLSPFFVYYTLDFLSSKRYFYIGDLKNLVGYYFFSFFFLVTPSVIVVLKISKSLLLSSSSFFQMHILASFSWVFLTDW